MRQRDSQEQGHVKFRYFSAARGEAIEFEVSGGNSSIDQGLRNIANALGAGQPTKVVAAPRTLPAQSAKVPAQLTLDSLGTSAAAEVEEQTGELVDDAATADSGETTGSSRPKSGPRKYPTPKFLDALKMDGWKEFAKRCAPKSHEAKNLLAAFWLKENLKTAAVDKDHVFTAYRHMDWNVEADVEQSLRKLKRKNWVSQDAAGFKLTHVGEDKARELIKA